MTQSTTESVRIDKELLNKIKAIAKAKGQTISGYMTTTFSKPVEKQWEKIQTQIEKSKKNSI